MLGENYSLNKLNKERKSNSQLLGWKVHEFSLESERATLWKKGQEAEPKKKKAANGTH